MTHRKRHIPRAEVKALDVAAEIIDRANKDAATSKQPRFAVDAKNAWSFFYELFGWAEKELIFNEPPYVPDSRRRDTWLAKAVTKEPYLWGVLQSIVSIDKNRGFTVTGGKTQVKRVVAALHNFQVAPDLFGWRPGISVTSQSFYQSDLGAPVELAYVDLGRGKRGPLVGLYAVDPTKCRLTGDSETPLQYAPGIARGGTDYWTNDDFFRVVSFPDPNETYSGLGHCFVSRCVELTKIIVSVFGNYREQLGSKAPKGILTVNGVSLSQWLTSLEESKAELKQLEREYYTGVQVLASDQGAPIDVKLVPLSVLPAGFDLKETLDLYIYGVALAAGYDPREFWPVSSGTLGTGKETETQHRKATSKGGLDFHLGLQEKLQERLPETVQYEIEQRDVDGDIAEIAFQKAKWEIIDGMNKSVNANGEILLTHDQVMTKLVDAELIPEEWTLPEEDVTVSDTDDADTAEMLTKERVRAAMVKYPDDDIVTYSENTGKFRVLRKAGTERRFMMRNTKLRADESLDIRVAVGGVVNFSDGGNANDIPKSLEGILRKSHLTKNDSPLTLGPEYDAVLGGAKLCSCSGSPIPVNTKMNCAGFPGEFGVEQSAPDMRANALEIATLADAINHLADGSN